MKRVTKMRQTMTARAAEIGITVQCLRNWKACGVDVYDDDQIRTRVAKSRHMPHGVKPEYMPAVSAGIPGDPDDPTNIDIEAIIGQIRTATDKHSAQTVKTQIDALVNAYKLREAAGKYIPKSTVEESLMRIGAAVKAAVSRMEADLPPMLEGTTPAQAQRIIRSKVDEVMAALSDATNEVWKNDESSP